MNAEGAEPAAAEVEPDDDQEDEDEVKRRLTLRWCGEIACEVRE